MKPSSSVNTVSGRCPSYTKSIHGEWKYTDNATKFRTGLATQNLACSEAIQIGEARSVRNALG